MPKYISVNQYRASDQGVVGTAANAGISDLALARVIAEAESDIDAFLAFPPYLNGGFEAHMTGLVQEGFDQYTRRLANHAGPVPIRNAQRYRIHISNANSSGVGLFAGIDTSDVVLNYAESYVEIVPLNAILWSLAPAVWDLGLDPPIIEADFEVGFFLPAWAQTLYNDSGDGKTYRALNAFWASVYTQAVSNQPNQLPPIPPVVYVAGVPQAGSSLTTALTSGSSVTSLAVAALPAAIGSAATLTLAHPTTGQTASVTTSAPAALGATSISINAFTPSVTWPLGTYVASGFALNYGEGLVTFAATQGTSALSADYTYTIPDFVRTAALAQTTWRLALRTVAQMGALPFDLARSGEQQVRRKEANSTGNSSLCTEAYHALAQYKSIPLA